jgi:hypothetical protein
MNAMTRVAKMLALMPVVALASACNGVSPASSTGLSRDLTADIPAAEGTATATGLRNKACALVGSVSLQVVAEDKRAVYIQASYRYTEPVAQDCPAPVWASRDASLQVDRTNPYRVAVLRTHDGAVTVQATAPNGVSNDIVVALGASTTDPVETVPTNGPVPTNRPVPTPTPVNCKAIDGIQVQVVQNPDADVVSLQARYTFSAPGNQCRIAPTWTASRKGLTVDPLNGFSASIPPANDATVVYVTAPNGVEAKVTF